MPSYYFNERFYIVYNINLIMFYDLLIFIFMSYIKPQQYRSSTKRGAVVYHTIPTSNHNSRAFAPSCCEVVYRTIPTSNHNCRRCRPLCLHVVYRTIPTSNHNFMGPWVKGTELYIVLFLHQTTTWLKSSISKCLLYIVLFLHQTTTY